MSPQQYAICIKKYHKTADIHNCLLCMAGVRNQLENHDQDLSSLLSIIVWYEPCLKNHIIVCVTFCLILRFRDQIKSKCHRGNLSKQRFFFLGWVYIFYLSVEAHCILGGFVEFRVFQHVLFPAGSLEDAQSERRQSSKDLKQVKRQRKIITIML